MGMNNVLNMTEVTKDNVERYEINFYYETRIDVGINLTIVDTDIKNFPKNLENFKYLYDLISANDMEIITREKEYLTISEQEIVNSAIKYMAKKLQHDYLSDYNDEIEVITGIGGLDVRYFDADGKEYKVDITSINPMDDLNKLNNTGIKVYKVTYNLDNIDKQFLDVKKLLLEGIGKELNIEDLRYEKECVVTVPDTTLNRLRVLDETKLQEIDLILETIDYEDDDEDNNLFLENKVYEDKVSNNIYCYTTRPDLINGKLEKHIKNKYIETAKTYCHKVQWSMNDLMKGRK